MPTYVYKFLATDETIEVQQAFTDDTLEKIKHPETGRQMVVKKVFQPVGVTFKGSGFFKNDNRGSKSGEATSSTTDSSGSSSSEASSGDKATSSSESTKSSDAKSSDAKKSEAKKPAPTKKSAPASSSD